MTMIHAVVWTDHHSANIVQFDADEVVAKKVQEHTHNTPQHNSEVRSEHEFFGSVCDALTGIKHVLVTGSHTATADFKHYVEKHKPQIATQIVGYEVVDHQSEGQLVAMGRKYFENYARMN
ncbi:MAG: hypothetical protein ABI277_14690 [Burkholderiaceae bacterium]